MLMNLLFNCKVIETPSFFIIRFKGIPKSGNPVMVGDQRATTADLVAEYTEAYELANGWKPRIEYRGNGWYQVDNEVIHRSTLLTEIGRLRALIRQQREQEATYAKQATKGIISRLIAKLRKI
jgi:hypothetical protein